MDAWTAGNTALLADDRRDGKTGPAPKGNLHTFGVGEMNDGLIHENVHLLNARYCVHS